MKVVEAVAEVLQRAGVEHLFGLLGAGNLALVGCAVEQRGLRYHALRHEASAVAAADTFARVTGRVGVATVTHGPGLTHAASAIVEAVKSSVPLLVVTSSVGRDAAHRNQAIDQAALVRSLGATPFEIGAAADARSTTVRALEHVRSLGRPAVLMLPEDLHDAPVGPAEDAPAIGAPSAGAAPAGRLDLEHAARLLLAAERPVVLAGRGAMQPATIADLRELGRRVGALLFTTLPAKDRFHGDEFDAGICGSFGDPAAVQLAADADVVLVVGSSLTSWTTQRGRVFSSATIIRCDSDVTTAGRGEAVFLGPDAARGVADLVAVLPAAGRTGYRTGSVAAVLHADADEPDESIEPDESDGTGLDPRPLVRAIGELLPRARTIVVDGGHFSGWPAMLVSTPPPGIFVYAHGYQCVGLALGNVVGAAIGAPATLPVAFVGDGGALMSLGELDAIVGLGVPVLVVVVNDAAYGAEYHQAAPGHSGLTVFPRTDFAAVARSLGGTGIAVDSLNDLDGLATWLAAPRGLCLLDCRVTRVVKADWLPGYPIAARNGDAVALSNSLEEVS